MRGAGGGFGADGSGGGVGGTTNSDLVTYSGIAPSTTTNVRDELDFRARNLGDIKIITSYADLEFHFPAVAGVHTITVPVKTTAPVLVLPAGFRIYMSGLGYIEGTLGSLTVIAGDVDGPLISGNPLRLFAVGLLNNNAGGSAEHFRAEAPANTLAVVRQVICVGTAKVGTATNILGLLTMNDSQWSGCADGLRYTGTVVACRHTRVTGSGMPANSAMFRLDSGLTLVIGMEWQLCNVITTLVNQYMVYLDPAATYPGGGIVPSTSVAIRLFNNAVVAAGAIGKIFDPAGLKYDAIQVVARGNQYERRSEFFGLASFVDAVNPIINTYSLANTFEPVPYANPGLTTTLTLSATSQRFRLVKDDPNPGDWYLIYDGGLTNMTAEVRVGFSYEAASTASNITARLEQNTGGGWLAIAGTPRLSRQVNGDPRSLTISGHVTLDPGNRFRFTIANDNSSATTELTTINISVDGDP